MRGMPGTMRVALVATLAAAVPAGAQDGSEGTAQRTPESAQRFLAGFFGQGGFDALTTVYRDKGAIEPYSPETHTNPPDGAVSNLYGRVAAWQAVDRCRSRIELAELRAVYDYQNLYQAAPFAMAFEVDWAKVTKIVRYRAKVPKRTSSAPAVEVEPIIMALGYKSQEVPAFLFDSEEEADRVAFAFSFLKQNCAYASDTGF